MAKKTYKLGVIKFKKIPVSLGILNTWMDSIGEGEYEIKVTQKNAIQPSRPTEVSK